MKAVTIKTNEWYGAIEMIAIIFHFTDLKSNYNRDFLNNSDQLAPGSWPAERVEYFQRYSKVKV